MRETSGLQFKQTSSFHEKQNNSFSTDTYWLLHVTLALYNAMQSSGVKGIKGIKISNYGTYSSFL